MQEMYVQINEKVFVSTLSKGTKLFYGALDRLPAYVVDPRQQELALDLPPPMVKVVCYEPTELAAFMQCGIATVRRYVKELIAAGWAIWYEGKSRGKNRKLVLRLEMPLAIEKTPTSHVLNPLSHDGRGQGEGESCLKLIQLEAFDMPVPPSPLLPLPQAREGELISIVEEIIPTEPSTAEPKEEEQPATGHIALPAHYVKAPLLMEDLAVLEHCVNEEGNLDDQGYNKTLNAYFSHLWATKQEHAFERAQKMIKIWMQLRQQHHKPCHGDAQYPKKIHTAEYYAAL